MTKEVKKNKGGNISTLIVFCVLLIIFTAVICFSSTISQSIQDLLFNYNILEDNISLRVHFIDVGQGDCIAINLPDGKTMLIDAGPYISANKVTDYLLSNVVNHKAKKKLDYLVLTHSDADHIGGMNKVLNTFTIGTIFRPAIASTADDDYYSASCVSDSETYNSVITKIKQLEANGTVVMTTMRGIKIETNKYSIEFLSPFTDSYTDANEYSPYILLKAYGRSFLFTGDATKSNELELMLAEPNMEIDVLKVAHHGSSTSTSADFVTYLSPEYAVISVAKNNNYGHPTSETIANITAMVDGDNILMTSVLSNISFVVGDGYDFKYLTGSVYTTINISDELVIIIASAVDAICVVVIVVSCIRQKPTKNLRDKS